MTSKCGKNKDVAHEPQAVSQNLTVRHKKEPASSSLAKQVLVFYVFKNWHISQHAGSLNH